MPCSHRSPPYLPLPRMGPKAGRLSKVGSVCTNNRHYAFRLQGRRLRPMACMAPPLASNNPRQGGQTVSRRAMQGNGETKMEAQVKVCRPIILINALHHRTPAHENAYMATKPQQT